MNALLGHVCVLWALASAVFGSVLGFVSGARHNLQALAWTRRAATSYAVAMLLANLVMVVALLQHDFSVGYVAQVGSRSSPTWITIVSLWSSLEGSILFWGAILGLYVLGFTRSERGRQERDVAYALGAILFVAAFFTLLVAAPADPFTHLDPAPADGPGPNPLLQNHILMAIHPPMLYLGYVGLTLPFGIAVAALLEGRLRNAWLKRLRRWTLIPWMFLSVGIVLGGWWAYEVLGWGGYWAWDPVENASFLPWLAATGYLHATMVHERRKILKTWTLSLVLGAFLLTILGTFMTRSGVFNSVHAFTQSNIGPMFLAFLAILLVASLGLLAGRAHLLEAEGDIQAVVSRETAFLLNNLLFVVFTFTVLLGTVFPLLTEALRGVQVSVGEPYFDRMVVPIGMLMVFLMGVGPALPWGKPDSREVLRQLMWPTLAGLTTVAICLFAGLRQTTTVATFGLCMFATVVTLREMFEPVWKRHYNKAEGFIEALRKSVRGQRRRFGGLVVHLAIIAIVVAIAASQTYRITTEAAVEQGQSFELGDYTFRYVKSAAAREPHRVSVAAHFEVFKAGEHIATMDPRLNFYSTQREPIGTPHVLSQGHTDLYLSLLSFEEKGQQVAVKAFVMPLVPWIWWSLPWIVLGSLISMWPRAKRRRLTTPTEAEVQA